RLCLPCFRPDSAAARSGAVNIRPAAMGDPEERMGADRQKIRVAEWLYRLNLSMGILGIVFTILTFLGVFTIVLGPLFTQQFGFTFLETALVLLVIVLVVIAGFGVYLDKVIAFWPAQATVATVRNPYLDPTLYQKAHPAW